jgi:ribosomal protein S27E
MASETRSPLVQLECPNCGKPINQYNATSQSLVCPACGSHIAIGIGNPELLSKGRRLPKPPRPVNLGATARIANKNYVVLGRVIYSGTSEGETFSWNEWMLGSEDGRILWLSFDENGFGLFQKLRFRYPFNPQNDSQLNLGDKKIFIRERYPAQIVGSEGELTWRAKPGDRLFVAEGTGSRGLRYSIQHTPQELEIYEGRAVTEKDLALSFNDQDWLKAIGASKKRQATLQLIAALCIAAAILGAFLALIAGATGDKVEPTIVELSQTTPRDSFELAFDNPRPAVIGITLISGSLPENSFIDIDMEITSPDGTKDELFSQEIWHETGSDEDGPWRETQYSTSEMFVPTQSGSHIVDVSYDGSVLSSLTLEVSVRRNHVMPIWFFIYAIVTGILGILALAASAPRATMNLIATLMDNDD